MTITLSIDGQNFPVIWEENEAVSTLKKALEKQPLTIHLSAYGGFEQVGELGMTLPSQNTQQIAQPGDIMLYNSSQLVLFYGQNRWSYTKLGHMATDAKSQLAKDKVTVTLTLEENND
ncbi:cyclophilin-like fold protein [Streptococcus orisasini]|uniref:cyclophilin-like fold protein n=1 Tax=Streptococcus orisasini TaxID=1080071 RepID=UPI00070DD481|nr:cyclophilin-like fold protein [Streptococcus orisasini]